MEAARILEPEYDETQISTLQLVEKPAVEIKIKKRLAYTFCKRIFDIVMSLVALIVLSPVFLITAVAIYAEDKGPVIFRQERTGKDEKIFRILKFRSMKVNASQIHEELRNQYGDQEVSFKLKDDPRVTKVGKVIRKFNIDELPQLLNILKGDMSIVGPRPLPVYEYQDEKKQYGEKYALRYAVPQGLTCIWQISNRGDVEFEERMQMDVTYAKECSARKDILLILRTMLDVISGKAEY